MHTHTHAHAHTGAHPRAHTCSTQCLAQEHQPQLTAPICSWCSFGCDLPRGISRNYERRQKRGAFGPHYNCVPPTHTHFGYKNAAVLQFIHCKTPLLPHPPPPTSSPPLSLSWHVTLMIQPNELSEMETLIYLSRWVSPLLCKKVAFCRIGPECADEVRAASLNHRVWTESYVSSTKGNACLSWALPENKSSPPPCLHHPNFCFKSGFSHLWFAEGLKNLKLIISQSNSKEPKTSWITGILLIVSMSTVSLISVYFLMPASSGSIWGCNKYL